MALREHEAKLARRRENRAFKKAKDAAVAKDEDTGEDEDVTPETPPVRPSKKRKLDLDVAVLRENGNGLAASGRMAKVGK